jgi:putative transposase
MAAVEPALEGRRAENSHLPIRRRERKMQTFKSRASAQGFLTTHAAVYNTFNTEPHLIGRATFKRFRAEAHAAWADATVAAPDLREGAFATNGC